MWPVSLPFSLAKCCYRKAGSSYTLLDANVHDVADEEMAISETNPDSFWTERNRCSITISRLLIWMIMLIDFQDSLFDCQ